MARNTYLHIGDILGTHGLKGTLIVYSHTRPADAVAGYSCWWLGQSAETAKTYEVKRCWQHGKRMLAEIDGITDCTAAEQFKGLKIWLPAAQVQTDDDEFLWDELIVCKVFRHGSDELLGTVTALEAYGAQDNLLIQTPSDAAICGEWLIPFTEDIIVSVDLNGGVIEVDLPDGMDVCFTPKF